MSKRDKDALFMLGAAAGWWAFSTLTGFGNAGVVWCLGCSWSVWSYPYEVRA